MSRINHGTRFSGGSVVDLTPHIVRRSKAANKRRATLWKKALTKVKKQNKKASMTWHEKQRDIIRRRRNNLYRKVGDRISELEAMGIGSEDADQLVKIEFHDAMTRFMQDEANFLKAN